MTFLAILPFYGTSEPAHDLQHDSLELLNLMSDYYPLVFQHVHGISNNIYTTEYINTNVIEAFITVLERGKDLGF